MEKQKNGFLVWVAKKLGPFVDKYRNSGVPEIYLPETTEDLVWELKRLPENVLSAKDRERIMMVMSFSDKLVRDLMLPREKITFVHVNDFMGPLTLDKLYKSGFSHFPVLDVRGGIAGVLHTSSLNSLEIKDTDRAASFLDEHVYYMRDNYTLMEAMSAFLRTNSYFFMVVNSDAQVVGLLTFKMLIDRLLGEIPDEGFSSDGDVMAVAKRRHE